MQDLPLPTIRQTGQRSPVQIMLDINGITGLGPRMPVYPAKPAGSALKRSLIQHICRENRYQSTVVVYLVEDIVFLQGLTLACLFGSGGASRNYSFFLL